MIFVTKMLNKFFSIKNILFSQILTQNASNQLKLEKNKQFGQQQKKLNVCQKLVKNTQNRLEMDFHDQGPKRMCF